MSTQHIRGLDQVLNVLSAMPDKMQKQAVRKGLTKAGAQIRDEARLRVREETGKLRKAIRTGSPRKNQDGTFSVRILVDERKEHGFLGFFHEYGVAAHFIAGKQSKVSSRKMTLDNHKSAGGTLKINGKFVSGGVLHPGFVAKPFMRPALDVKADEAVKALAFEIEEFVFDYSGFQALAA